MTQDEILDMWGRAGGGAIKNMPYTLVERFAKLVALRYEKKISDLENIICQRHWDVLQEREACAKICDEWANSLSGEPEMVEMAKEIRARSNA